MTSNCDQHQNQALGTPPHNYYSWTDQRVSEIKKKYEASLCKYSSESKVKKHFPAYDKQNQQRTLKTLTSHSSVDKPYWERNSSNIPPRLKTLEWGSNITKKPEMEGFAQKKGAKNPILRQQSISAFQTTNTQVSTFDLPLQQHHFNPVGRVLTESSSYCRQREPPLRVHKREIYDSRLENIERINSKIKKILECINTCEAEQSQNHQKEHKAKGVKVSSTSKNHIQTTQLVSSSFTKKSTQARSSSCFTRLRRQDSRSNPYAFLNQQKISQIDSEINKFHNKIGQLERQKRKMNINFTPFHYQSSPVKRTMEAHIADKIKKARNLPSFREDSSGANFFKELPSRMSIGTINQPDLLESRKQSEHILKTSSPKKYAPFSSLVRAQSDQTQSGYQEQAAKQSEVEQVQPYDNAELRAQVGMSMHQRERRLQQLEKSRGRSDFPCTYKFLQTLSEQVRLDEQSRNSKNWFSESHNPSKIDQLRTQFKNFGVEMSLQNVRDKFCNFQDMENDPFFSFREQKYTISSVAGNYLETNRFWLKMLRKQWHFSELDQENFSKSLLKKQLRIEDLVRLLNTHTGSFYCNRDLYLIFERIKMEIGTSAQTINLEEFKRVFAKCDG